MTEKSEDVFREQMSFEESKREETINKVIVSQAISRKSLEASSSTKQLNQENAANYANDLIKMGQQPVYFNTEVEAPAKARLSTQEVQLPTDHQVSI